MSAALIIRTHGLDRYSLWLDETAQYSSSVSSISGLFQNIFAQEMFLSFLVGRPFVLLGLDGSAWLLRLPFMVFGVMTVGAVWLLARELFGRTAAWLAGVFACLCPILIVYSQEYRMYSLFALLSCLSTWALAKALATNRPPWWTSFAVLTLLTLYTHFVALIVLAGHFLFLIGWLVASSLNALSHRSAAELAEIKNRFVSMTLAGTVIAVGYLPVLPLLGRYVEVEGVNPGADGLPLELSTLLRIFGTYPGFGESWLTLAFVSLAVLGVGFAVTRRPLAAALLSSSIGFPLLVFCFVGGGRVMSSGRYLIFIYPIYAVAVGAGLAGLLRGSLGRVMRSSEGPARRAAERIVRAVGGPGNASVVLGIVVLVAVLTPLLPGIYSTSQKPIPTDLRSAYESVLSGIETQDLLLQASSFRPGSVWWFSLYDTYFLREELWSGEIRKGVVAKEQLTASLSAYLAMEGRLWVIATIRPADTQAIRTLSGLDFDVYSYQGIVVLRAADSFGGNMHQQLATFLDRYSELFLADEGQAVMDELDSRSR